MPLPTDREFNAVLFDLDGTLIDTAPDMVAVLQDMQRDRDLEPVSYAHGRRSVSNGALGLLGLAFPPDALEFRSPLHLEFLERYAERLCVDSSLFPGMPLLLETLEEAGRPWGIVTNKPAHLTDPLLDGLGLAERSAATVSGDTLPLRKPDPAPMLHACEMAGVDAGRTIYVGDAARDIEAGLAAGMATIGVRYGYITEDDDPEAWGAHVLAANTAELAQILLKAVNLGP